ncbi:FixH family protein [Cytobacillus praedii]|uniref:YtkA-like domain-containing protein n=1 Tax=Cytobacillus praedii TaxID=1742358 RepID=A0A4R1APA7_9BACI|nr:FixH family protein [Cytobacillus praedii]MED3550342.1 FixH family protein [Cytobacillus praedii]TCJ01238.1 hypothetical protein E0Y62_25005 [Cytobacillus praedii]
MTKKGYLLFAILVFTFISGCSKESKLPELIEVKVELPSVIMINKEVELQANVTQGKEQVSDADKVEFEIWREGQSDEEHKKIEAEINKDGNYYIKETFKETGKYFVIAHVTARDMHTMPKVEFEVAE